MYVCMVQPGAQIDSLVLVYNGTVTHGILQVPHLPPSQNMMGRVMIVSPASAPGMFSVHPIYREGVRALPANVQCAIHRHLHAHPPKHCVDVHEGPGDKHEPEGPLPFRHQRALTGLHSAGIPKEGERAAGKRVGQLSG